MLLKSPLCSAPNALDNRHRPARRVNAAIVGQWIDSFIYAYANDAPPGVGTSYIGVATGELLSLRINTRWQQDSIIPLAKQKISNVSHCLHGICFFKILTLCVPTTLHTKSRLISPIIDCSIN